MTKKENVWIFWIWTMFGGKGKGKAYEKGFKFKGFLLQRFVSTVMVVCLAC